MYLINNTIEYSAHPTPQTKKKYVSQLKHIIFLLIV